MLPGLMPKGGFLLAAPVITSALSASGQQATAFSYTITASNDPTSFNATGLPAGLWLSGATITGTPTVSGTYYVTISATNAGGTGSATLTISLAAPAAHPGNTAYGPGQYWFTCPNYNYHFTFDLYAAGGGGGGLIAPPTVAGGSAGGTGGNTSFMGGWATGGTGGGLAAHYGNPEIGPNGSHGTGGGTGTPIYAGGAGGGVGAWFTAGFGGQPRGGTGGSGGRIYWTVARGAAGAPVPGSNYLVTVGGGGGAGGVVHTMTPLAVHSAAGGNGVAYLRWDS